MSVTTERPDELIEILEGDLLSRNDKINRWGNAISSFQNIPGLVGFWPMSSVQRSTGNAFDLTSQGRTLTYNGNPTYNIYNDFMPYIDFDGTGDFLSRADETDLDVLGTETIYNSSVRGLTVGAWVWFDSVSGIRIIISKDDVGANRSWSMWLQSSLLQSIVFAPGGGSFANTVSTTTLVVNTWHFCVFRFVASTSLTGFINGVVEGTDTSSVPASINSTAASLEIGRDALGRNLDGREALCFMSANALSNALINSLFQQSRVLFRV